MAVTIKQIAELAGVSRGTVDRALNHRGGVNPEVEKRILELAKQLDYRPNVMAKALANSRKRQTIGVIVNSGGNGFFDDVLRGIHKASRQAESFKISVILEQLTGYEVHQQLEAIDNMLKREIHGLVITPINDPQIIHKLNQVSSQGIAIVTLNADVTGIDKLAFVGCDYYKSGQTAAELMGLITSGHAQIGIITGSKKMLGHTKRIEGFCKTISQDYPQSNILNICEAFDNDEIAYEKTKDMLSNDPRINSLYFSAAGIDGGIRAVQEFPERKLSIITVDATPNIKEYLQHGLIQTTVCQQPYKQGYDAIDYILKKLVDGKKPPRKHMYTQNEIKTKYNLD